MGVDIQTYRGRIGCFSRHFGTDVIIVQCTVNCTRGIKTIGAVVFIGILLLLAGIEQNPGPISESTSERTPANATILKVCGLQKNIGIDSLINKFENTRRQGGGNVLRVDIDENESSALVEFEEAEALQLVLSKRPIQIDGKDVSVEIYIDEGSMGENNSLQIDRADEVFADNLNDLELGSDFEHVNKSGPVAKVTSAVKHVFSKGFRKGLGFFKAEKESAETDDSNLVEKDIERPDSATSEGSQSLDDVLLCEFLHLKVPLLKDTLHVKQTVISLQKLAVHKRHGLGKHSMNGQFSLKEF